MSEELRYRYEIVINTLGRDSWSTTAKDDRAAIRNILFRERGKMSTRPSVLSEADQVFENKAYSVITRQPLYGEIFDIDKLHQWEKDINDVKDTFNGEEDDS